MPYACLPWLSCESVAHQRTFTLRELSGLAHTHIFDPCELHPADQQAHGMIELRTFCCIVHHQYSREANLHERSPSIFTWSQSL